MSITRVLALGAVVTVVAALGIAVAVADDDSDRASLMTKIEAKLGVAANNLYNVQSNGSTSEIDSASNAVRDVQSLVDDLKRVAGSDSAAEKIISYYPDYAKTFYPAADELKKLKRQQLVKGDSEVQCKALDTELVRQIARMKDDPEAAAEIISAAGEANTRAERVMSTASSQASEVTAAMKTATNFSATDNGWKQVTTNLHASANAIATDWTAAYDAAKQACAPLLRGEAHPAVAHALAKLAGSSEGRKQLLETVTKAINVFAEKLREVPGASGTSAVDIAGSQLDEVNTAIRTLANAQGDDTKTKKIIEQWQVISPDARTALGPLRELKMHHHVLDGLPEKCDGIEKELDAFIKEHATDADAVKSLPAEAERLGNPVVVGMELARKRHTQMGTDRDSVFSFKASDGPWSGVTTAFKGSAATIFDDYTKGMATLEARCGNITLTSKHPKVLEAVKALETNTTTTGKKLEDDIDQWVKAAKATYRLDCDGMKEIWEGYCGVDWSPTADTAEDEAAAKAIAVNLQKEMQKSMQPLLDQLPDLDARVNALLAKEKTRSEGARLAKMVDTERTRLERLKNQDVWKGNFSSMKQFSQNFGINAHEQMWSRFSCQVPIAADKTAIFPGGKHTKPDCINVDTCVIIEFKPDNQKAKNKGEEQLSDYERYVPKLYERHIRENTEPESAHGGVAVRDAIAKNCKKNNNILFARRLETYNLCDMKYECTK